MPFQGFHNAPGEFQGFGLSGFFLPFYDLLLVPIIPLFLVFGGQPFLILLDLLLCVLERGIYNTSQPEKHKQSVVPRNQTHVGSA